MLGENSRIYFSIGDAIVFFFFKLDWIVCVCVGIMFCVSWYYESVICVLCAILDGWVGEWMDRWIYFLFAYL